MPRRAPTATLALLLALASLSCAHARARPVVGHAHLKVVEPMTATQTLVDLALTLEQGGIGAGATIHFVHFEGCLRGDYLLKTLYACPSDEPNEPRRWRGTLLPGGSPSGTLINFTALVEGDHQSLLHVVIGRQEATVRLGAGDAVDEVRESPELVGVLFALGLPPAAKDGVYELVDDAVAAGSAGAPGAIESASPGGR